MMRIARIYDPPRPDEGVNAGPVTLLTSAKDVEHGHLVVLKRWLETRR